MLMIRTPKEADWAFWHSLDPELPFDRFLRKIRDRQGYVLFAEDEPAAVLRFDFFLDRVPFLSRLAVSGEERFSAQRLDAALLAWWEQDMLLRGFGLALVSAGGEADAALYRGMGYREAGALAVDLPGAERLKQAFLAKALQAGCACGQRQKDGAGA